jgi:RNA polymerase sigma-70 factor, ECF subfamily
LKTVSDEISPYVHDLAEWLVNCTVVRHRVVFPAFLDPTPPKVIPRRLHMSSLICTTAMNDQAATPVLAGAGDFEAKVRAGVPDTFADLYALYSRRLYKTIFAITKHPEDTEDALQDTFMRACLAMHTFEGRSTIYSWLTRIAINSALLVLRKRRIRSEICLDPHSGSFADTAPLDIRDSAPNPEQLCDLNQRYTILIRAVGNLRASLRTPIQMRMETESSLKEISQRLRISEGAVKARLHRARARLSSAFENA